MVRRLRQNIRYRGLEQDEQGILQRCPFILRMLEGEKTTGEITLSTEEQKAFAEYFAVQLSKDNYRELELYIMGQGELVKYFNMLLC